MDYDAEFMCPEGKEDGAVLRQTLTEHSSVLLPQGRQNGPIGLERGVVLRKPETEYNSVLLSQGGELGLRKAICIQLRHPSSKN